MALLRIENLKTFLILGAIIAAVWFFKDYEFQKSENERQSKNMESIRKQDSLRYSNLTYTKKEIDEYLEYQRLDLKDFLSENKINTRKIEKIITQQLSYRDTATRNQDLSPILEAIRENKEMRVPIVDSTDCLIVKGYVVFENDTLSLDITDRQFTNTSDVISYWERNQWSFLGIKTRLFGRKEATVIIKDKCGRTQTFVIDKRQ